MEEQGAAAAAPLLASKQEGKIRKKDQKCWENVVKATAAMDQEAKQNYIKEKYKEMYENLRQLTQTNLQLTKQNAAIQKERDHNQAELTKSILARARLENLCRELQKQNKQIKEENIAKIREEEVRRKEVSLKFADKLTDINNMMDENKEKSDKLRDENLKMTAKLADLYNQFQKREEDITKMSKQLDLERQFSQATLAKMELEIKAEKEIHLKEQSLMKSNLEKSEANCAVLLETVKGLQDHIDVYKTQYEDFESTMSKSTKVFDNFKSEIAAMTKQVSTLEQEAQTWKNKFNDSMIAILEMSELKRNQELHIQSADKKVDQLNKLCRQLQVDRSHYLKLLKSNGIEPSPSPQIVEKPPEDEHPKRPTKITKKEKELQALKNNLKAVQDELTRIKIDDVDKSETIKTDQSSQDMKEESAKCDDVQSPPDLVLNTPSVESPNIKPQNNISDAIEEPAVTDLTDVSL